MKLKKDQIALAMFLWSAALAVFAYGLIVGEYRIFPYHQIRDMAETARDTVATLGVIKPWYYRNVIDPKKPTVYDPGGAEEGVNLITCVGADHSLWIKLMRNDGTLVHQWEADWFKIWPEADHLRSENLPKSRPGTHIHGAVILDGGDVVFNFENLGLVRLDVSGNVVWKLPYRTHHSVSLHDDGNLWVSGEVRRYERSPQHPEYSPPFDEYTVLEVSRDGEILREISVFDLLRNNELAGLLYLSTKQVRNVTSTGDTLHLNDVERFPASMKPGFFDSDDVMISLRNIHTILVFDLETLEIKFQSTGRFVRQHDPDFIDANTISVFDNNLGRAGGGLGSRIVKLSVPDGGVEKAFAPSDQCPFYSDIMGKHQYLPGGNLLITSAMRGRAFEVNPAGEIVWEFTNYVDNELAGIVEEVTRLPLSYAHLYSAQ